MIVPRLELAISVGNGDKTAVVSKLDGPGTLAETVELLAVAAHAIMELASSVDRNALGDGSVMRLLEERMDELNQNPKSAGVIACRIESGSNHPKKGNFDEPKS